MNRLGLWKRLAKVVGHADAIIHVGDQIYGDEDVHAKTGRSIRFMSSWASCMNLTASMPRSQWDDKRNKMLEYYRETYRRTWNQPDVASVLASAANYMVIDDHEVVDDLGDEEVHADKNSQEFYVICVAYQAYCEYQRQLFSDIDVTNPANKAYITFKIGKDIGVFLTDNRVERSIHRAMGNKRDWGSQAFLGPAQWKTLANSFNKDFQDCKAVLLGTPTPAVFISQRATTQAVKVISDARGTWGHINFK
ncbi:unnamed protein product, partial [Discosporangium mesarthrocarpum]